MMHNQNIFEEAFVKRGCSFAIKEADENSLYKCWFGGIPKAGQKDRFLHFATFSASCFSGSATQENISILVDPDTPLPEWQVLTNAYDENNLEGACEFNLELEKVEKQANGSKIGGEAYFIRGAQAAKMLKEIVEPRPIVFIIQLDEEDFFALETPGIDKRLRDCLCGGAIYVYASLEPGNNTVVAFSDAYIDHQM